MAADSNRGSRWRLVRDVVVFQVKLGAEALLDITLIPVSLAAAGAGPAARELATAALVPRRAAVRRTLRAPDRPVGREGGRERADLEINAVMRSIETLVRQPGSGPQKVRELRRWAAMKLAPGGDDEPPPTRRNDRAG